MHVAFRREQRLQPRAGSGRTIQWIGSSSTSRLTCERSLIDVRMPVGDPCALRVNEGLKRGSALPIRRAAGCRSICPCARSFRPATFSRTPHNRPHHPLCRFVDLTRIGPHPFRELRLLHAGISMTIHASVRGEGRPDNLMELPLSVAQESSDSLSSKPILRRVYPGRRIPCLRSRRRRFLQQARNLRTMDQGGQGPDQMDAAVAPLLRRQHARQPLAKPRRILLRP